MGAEDTGFWVQGVRKRATWMKVSLGVERGQAMAVGVLMVGGVGLVVLALGVAVGLAVGGKAELTKAADAAALAVAATGVPHWTLQVPYVLYVCRRFAGMRRHCVAVAGGTQIVQGTRTGLFATTSGPLGLESGWAARGGCAPPSGPGVGSNTPYRLCGQPKLVNGVLRFPSAATIQAVATEWLRANAPSGGLVTGAEVVGVRTGRAGDVTVRVEGSPLLGLRGTRLYAQATAWMGG